VAPRSGKIIATQVNTLIELRAASLLQYEARANVGFGLIASTLAGLPDLRFSLEIDQKADVLPYRLCANSD
jgi:hypothetical protein